MKTIKIILAGGLFAVFLFYLIKGWGVTCINVWNGQALPNRLPVMLLVAFLAGLVPMYFWHGISNWSLKRKISNLESEISNPQSTG